MITLYDYELSGNCYKIRLFLSILNMGYQTEPVEFYPSREHKSEAFLKINPLGQLPALKDGDLVLRDAQAILVYLATQYDKSCYWYPTARPDLMAEVNMWMAFADSLTSTISSARLHDLFFYEFDVNACRLRARDLLRILDEHLWFRDLKGLQYICSSLHPTIADIACFPYIALSDEAGVSLEDFPAVRRWVDRVKRLPGFVVMSGVFPTSPMYEGSARRVSA
ncbi:MULTISPECIES: glutathione S-transferase family protein [Pseudomonas]|uniref:NdmE n=1 Tax=Pseudomonas putida TaxID=303 RepID=R9TPE4_PSEPU|nr:MULTISPECIES: glutathione S-transferase [Pseudomonas]AGN33262.1 NdmE [Pseudomonas putida]KKX57999.1 glutathione S-transferase [Pseudomonas putida]QFG33879.1 glutathione S-transferase [Pseudomonas umsongensis]